MSGAGGLRRLPAGTPWSPPAGPDDALARGWNELERGREAIHAQAADLAFTLAARVLSSCAAQERVVAVEALRVALAADLGAAIRLARVHPVDLAACEAEAARADASVRIAIDPSLRPGDVVLEGAAGVIDLRLTARLAALRATLESVA